jgi:hypothetical protein
MADASDHHGLCRHYYWGCAGWMAVRAIRTKTCYPCRTCCRIRHHILPILCWVFASTSRWSYVVQYAIPNLRFLNHDVRRRSLSRRPPWLSHHVCLPLLDPWLIRLFESHLQHAGPHHAMGMQNRICCSVGLAPAIIPHLHVFARVSMVVGPKRSIPGSRNGS